MMRKLAIRWISTCVLLLVLLLAHGLSLSVVQARVGRPAAAQVLDTKSGRTRVTINSGWRFLRADVAGAEAPRFDDTQWAAVELPHTWNAFDTHDDVPRYWRGVGWYRRHLTLDEDLRGQRLFLYFEGANQVADVYVNGRHVGRHVGGYTAFACDITAAARIGETNLVAVKVDNSHNKDIPPTNADFNFYGGLYRDVWLVATDPLHFTLGDNGSSSGVYVETPQVSAASALVRVRGTLVNDSDESGQLTVTSTVFDADGHSVLTVSAPVKMEAGKESTFEQTTAPLPRPHLWSPAEPHLYTVRTTVRAGTRVLDEVTSPLGFRWYSFDAARGFSLNGAPLKLRGTNRHQDYPGLGNAVPDRLHVRDMELIKDAGFNFVRLAHYPQDPSVLEAADRLGLIIWEEIPVVNQITVAPEFNANAEHMLVEMIRQHRNHPAIFLWGYMNEVFLGPKMSDEHVRATVALARALEAVCRREDPTRLTTIALHYDPQGLYESSGLYDITRVVGLNLYFGWYYDTFADFGKFVDEQHRRHPDRPLFISEYGANSDTRLHSRAPRRYDSTAEWQRMYHESYLAQIDARPFLAGGAVWSTFDFGAEQRGETIPHTNQKGLFTATRRPKDVLYFYRAQFAAAPVLHIATRDWPRRTGGADAIDARTSRQTVNVYTNLPAVELVHNGVSLGVERIGPSRRAAWPVAFHDGVNALVARGRHAGHVLTDSAEVYFALRPQRLADPAYAFKELAVNVGSNAQFVDAWGTMWEADQAYAPGGWGYVGADTKETGMGQNVNNTDEDPLYQTMREGLSGYRFDVPDGEYEIELRFVERESTAADVRVFSVGVNGAQVVARLDLAAQYGLQQPVKVRTTARAAGGLGLRIGLTPIVGRTVLSAVRVRRV
ncbi:MAG: glycoside hydrolase family 2 TIM barrel-domain containing protein [Pyrinomonadaceae bacterium]